MADPSEKHDANVEGRYYVDLTCIYCDLCREIAPTIFAEFENSGFAYVFSQPDTEVELALAQEALEGCPTESIGDHQNPGIEFNSYVHGASAFGAAKKWWQFWRRGT